MKTYAHKSLIFLGDIHGCFFELWELLNNVNNSLVIQVGDCGLGFHKLGYEQENLKNIDNVCQKNNNDLILIRGNHDSKQRFEQLRALTFQRILFPKDYDVIGYNNKTIQLVGGAISIDRTGRQEGVSYWIDEGVVFDREKCQPVDILVTHTAPSWCFPQTFNELVYGWAGEDAYLIEDLTEERALVDEIFKLCKPKLHVYGHFHSSWSETINDCKHKLVDINEAWEYIESNE